MAAGNERQTAGLDPLVFRRQFLLADQESFGFPGWRRQAIAGRYVAAAHPDLELTHVEEGGRSITLLGYVLDPDRPADGNREILEALLLRVESEQDPARLVSRLGGRFVIVTHDGQRTTLFHDAAGLRQVYYATQDAAGHRRLVCGSQPGLVAEYLGFAPDPQALDYVAALGDDDFTDYYLPGDRSPYAAIRALLPNHRLRLDEGRADRYWPAGPLSQRPYDEALERSVRLLRGLFDAAARRYPLALSMTAGWDSRLMLALSRGLEREVFYFTIVYPDRGERSRDVAVPAELLQKLGLGHHLVLYPERVDPAFRAVAKRNTAAFETAYCADVQALYERVPSDRLCVTGDVAEVAKVHYRLPGRSVADVTVSDLARLCAGGSHPFAEKALEDWRGGVGENDAIAIGDLFCWEYMAGRWQALIRAQHDIVQETFAPLNCRDLLNTMLAVDEHRRSAPDYPLFRDIIQALWKDVLAVPINPPEEIGWKRRLERAFYRSRVRQVVPPSVRRSVKRLLRR